MKRLFKLKPLVLALPVVLAACGGGGGSSGETHSPYSITLRADKTTLPVNAAGIGPGAGVNAPYTTTLYVQAMEGGRPIPGGEDGVFACDVKGGLESGSLYYLDGKPEHEVEIDDGNGGKIKVPGAYRNITLGANAGGNTFHFHSKSKEGVATITCEVTDPRDQQRRTASVNITVGGGNVSTNVPARIQYRAQAEAYLGTSANLANLPNEIKIVASVRDDRNQPIAENGKRNVQLNILPTSASLGAKLMAGGQTGTALQVSTQGGEALFSVASGPNPGLVVVEMITDRADNDVSNGIQQPIRALTAIPAVKAVTAAPMIPDLALTATNAQPFLYYLEAQGGLPPFQWSTASPLPDGLSLSPDGVISGTPWLEKPGVYTIQLQVTDANYKTAVKVITLTVSGNLPDKPVDFAVAGCENNDINTACALPGANVSEAYTYAFTVTSGDNVKWKVSGLPSWLKLDANTDVGVISSSGLVDCTAMASYADPARLDPKTSKYTFAVMAYNDTNAVTRTMSITVKDDAGVCTLPPPPPPAPAPAPAPAL